MDNRDLTPGKSNDEGMRYWAKLEGKSNTMTQELAQTCEYPQQPSSLRRQVAWGCAVAVYLVVALGLATLVLTQRSSGLFEAESTPRIHLVGPKYIANTSRE